MRCPVRPLNALSILLLVLWAGVALAQADSTTDHEDTAPSLLAVPTAPGRLQVSWDATVASHYSFQGIDFSGGNAVAQPELVVGYGSWSSKLWFNQDLELAEVRELDFLAGYARPLHGLDLAVGYTRLTFPNTEAASSQELTFLMERAGAVTSSLDVHWDFDAGRGVYSTFGLSGDLPTPLKPVNLAVEVHHQSSYFDATGIPCMGVTLGIEHGIGGVTVTPAVSRFMSWENATFRGASMVPASWLVSLGVAQEF